MMMTEAERIEAKRARDRAYQAKRRADKRAGLIPSRTIQSRTPSNTATGTVNVALVLDASGSMNHLRDTAIEQINRQVENLRRVSSETGQKTSVTLFLFNNRHKMQVLARGVPPTLVPRVDRYNYIPSGQTALLDAIKDATHSMFDDGNRTSSYLVIAITDGQENDSYTGRNEIQELIRLRQGTDRWTFALLVPPGGRSYALSLGIPEGNIQEWETSRVGLERMSSHIISSASSYYNATQRGVTATKSFFTDLSNIGTKDLKQLDDLTGTFKHWQVKNETDIRSFVESHGVHYQVGRAYYQLTKVERVQYHKDFVIQDKTTKRLYGGDQARDLVGISRNAGSVVRVNPGNHANYNLFVQSTSTNRKLVRGTTLLYRA